MLIEHNFAKKYKNNIVISSVDFYVDYNKYYKNKQIEYYYEKYEKENNEELLSTIFYDLNINSCIFFDLENLIKFNENPAYIEIARRSDNKKEEYYRRLKNVDNVYLKILLEKLFYTNDNLINFIENSIKQEYIIDKALELIYNQNLNENNIERIAECLNLLFLNIIEENVILNNDYYNYHDLILFKMNEIDNNSEEYLIMFAKLFIMDINYWLKSEDHRINFKPLSREVYDSYPEIITKFQNDNIDNIFTKAYNSIKIPLLKDNKKLTKFYFINSFIYSDLEDINREIEHYFFDEYLLFKQYL